MKQLGRNLSVLTAARGRGTGSAGAPRGTGPDPCGGVAAQIIARPVWIRRFDCWAASYDASQLQAVLYARVHDAVLRHARCHAQDPRRVLDVGCGTGRLAGRIVAVYPHAHVVGVDASTEMINNARTTLTDNSPRFVSGIAERLPFTDAVFDLVVITLSLSHWQSQAVGLAEVYRVMAPRAAVLAAEVVPGRPSPPIRAQAQRRGPGPCRRLPQLITASGLRVRHVEPIRSVSITAGTTLIVAEKPC
jgi:SAM-dependent methyltransferase